MNTKSRVTTVLVLAVVAVAFCFGSVSMVEAKGPIWQIYKARTNKSIPWKTHTANPRFAKWKSGTNGDTSDDIVLDKETGLVWERAPIGTGVNWYDACDHCRGLGSGRRIGWRLPTVEELSTLYDTSGSVPPLPQGHPFLGIYRGDTETWFWTQTTYQNSAADALQVCFGNSGTVAAWTKMSDVDSFVWCVRGGVGHDAY